MKPGELRSATISTMYTASTVVWVLGLTAPADWAGNAVIQAYDSGILASE